MIASGSLFAGRVKTVPHLSTIIRQAAVLAVDISQAQAFLDGNKRTVFLTCDVFLRLNGLAFIGNPMDLAMQLEAITVRISNLEDATDGFEEWLCKQVD